MQVCIFASTLTYRSSSQHVQLRATTTRNYYAQLLRATSCIHADVHMRRYAHQVHAPAHAVAHQHSRARACVGALCASRMNGGACMHMRSRASTHNSTAQFEHICIQSDTVNKANLRSLTCRSQPHSTRPMCTRLCAHTCACTLIGALTRSTPTRPCTHSYGHICAHMCLHMGRHMRTQMRTHMRTHVFTYAHTHRLCR